jgi:hypothetical protein
MAPEQPQGTQKAVPPSLMPRDKHCWRVALAHAVVAQLLSEHRDELDNLAHVLLQAETLDAPGAYAAAGIPMPRTDSSRPDGRGVLA